MLRSLRVVATVGGLQSLLALLYFARSKAIALLLGPAGVGIVSLVDQIVMVVTQVSALALAIAPMKFISRTLNHGTEAVKRVYEALFKSLLISTLAGTALGYLVFTIRPSLLGPKLVAYKEFVLIGVLAVPALALTMFFANVLASARGYRQSLYFLLFSGAGSLIAAYSGIRLGGIAGLYWANLIFGAIAIVGALTYLHTSLHLAPHSRGFRLREEFRKHPDLLAYCTVLYVLSFAQPLSFLAVRYAVLKTLGAVETGYFQAAFLIGAPISLLLTQALRTYFEPIANRDLAVQEKTKSANEFTFSQAVSLLPGALVLVLFPREAVTVLFSSAFTPAVPFVFLFVLSECIFLTGQVYLVLQLGMDDLRGFFGLNLFGYVCLAALTWVAAPQYGLWGVAGAFVVSRGTVFALSYLRVSRKYGLRMPRRQAIFLLYAVVCLCLAGFFGSRQASLSVVNFGLRVAILAAFAGGALTFLSREERSWLGGLWMRWRTNLR
jgi:O-antigen/teichoic acid export membrane protein